MKLKYTRIFECEVSADDVVAALRTRIADWGEDCEGSVGIQDMLYQLDSTGLLVGEIESDDEPELDSLMFAEDFYTVESLQNELSDEGE